MRKACCLLSRGMHTAALLMPASALPLHTRAESCFKRLSLQERGLTVDKSFKGVFTMGGRMDGMDCAAFT